MKQIIQKGLLLVAITIGLAFHLRAQSTQMTIYMLDGTEQSYYMSESDRMYFEDNETLVVEIAVTGVGAKSDRYNLAEIRKITCNEVEGMIEDTDARVFLTPNPAHDVFILHNFEGMQSVGIYSLDGRLMKSVETTSDQPIDSADLPIGLYLVKTALCTLKMIKL